MWKNLFKELKRKDHQRYLGGLDIFKYIGPAFLIIKLKVQRSK